MKRYALPIGCRQSGTLAYIGLLHRRSQLEGLRGIAGAHAGCPRALAPDLDQHYNKADVSGPLQCDCILVSKKTIVAHLFLILLVLTYPFSFFSLG